MSQKQMIWHLVKFELNHSKRTLLLLLGSVLVLTFLMSTAYFDEETTADFGYMFLVILLVLTVRPAVFRTQNTADGMRVVKHLVHLQQLPICKKVILRYRFIMYYLLSIPLIIMFLTSSYIFSTSLKALISINEFMIIIIMWIAIHSLIVNIQFIMDIGTRLDSSIVYSVLLAMIALIVVLIVLTRSSEGSILYLMIQTANNFPKLTVFFSLLTMVSSTIIAYYWSLRRMKKVDYIL